jgi:predicted RND superfamily exporter protein
MNKIASSKHNPEVNSYYFMGALILEVLLDVVRQDALLALASFLFVFIYLRIMVGSWFLACIGMTEILFSVPVSWFIYNTIFRVKYFAFLNTLTLFIVAAIGADDIFIFMDAYKLSGQSKDPEILESLESRMSWVYRRTGFAMAITSATTCSAFLCTLITPLAGVQAFGIFAATVILIDYVLVMTLFCTAVVIYHNKYERPGCCSSCSAGCSTIDPSSTQEAFAKVNSDDDFKRDRISTFFRTKMSPFINTPLNRLFLGIAFLLWLVIAVIYALRITPTKEEEQFLSEDHPLQKSITILNRAFPIVEDDEGLNIHFIWGLNKVSRKGVSPLTDPEFFGNPKFLDTFEFNEVCQTEMLQVCTDLKQNDLYVPYIKQAGGLGAVSCFIEELAAYNVLGSLDDCMSVLSGEWKNEVWQIPEADIPAMMQSFIYERSCYSEEGSSIMEQYKDNLGFDGTAMRFAGLSVESSVIDPFSTLPEKTVREQYDKMIEISKKIDDVMIDACGGKTLMTDLDTKFVFMNNQRIYTRSALTSSILGVCIAFTVLLVSTRVFHIAFFATLSIICVLVSVTGSMVIIGWDLGSIEAILISIVAGFSVDYVVHLAHSYVQSRGNTAERITQAFGEMGISVLNGMVTSVGASIPLFFCQLQFFKKFGTFLCLTIAFSWLFANFGFMSVLAQLKIPIKKKGAEAKNAGTKHSDSDGVSDEQGNGEYSNDNEYDA